MRVLYLGGKAAFLVLSLMIIGWTGSLCQKNSEVRDELYQASYIGDVEKVEYLLNLDPNILTSRAPVMVNRKNEPYGRTAMMVCGLDPQKVSTDVDSDCTKIVRLIHSHGGNLNISDNSGWDTLSLAAFRGLTKLSRYIVKSNQVPIDRKDKDGRTPLMKAAANGYNSTFRMLLKYGANPVLIDNKGQTSLHYVTLFAIKDHEVGIPILAQTLVNLQKINLFDVVDKEKRNILMYASIANDEEVLRCILNHLQHSIDEQEIYGNSYKLDQKDIYQMTAMSMSSSSKIKDLLSTFEINSVLKLHEIWLKQQQKLLLANDELTMLPDDSDNSHVIVIRPPNINDELLDTAL